MTLTIHKEEDEQRQLLITIEVAETRIEKQMRETARKLARDFNIPGFRKGRAPYHVIVGRIGRDTLRTEAVEELVQPIFEEALEDIDPDIYAPAQFNDMELEPLVLKFTIPLTPEIELGDYRSLRKEIEPVIISEEAVAEALENIRTRHQVLEEVDRPAEAGDMVTISGKGELILYDEADDAEETETEDEEADDVEETDTDTDGEGDDDEIDPILFDEEQLELLMDPEKLFPGTPFVENIIGMTAGDSTSFDFTFPETFDDEAVAGKEATFDITILNVQSRLLPELNDDLAKEEGHESFEEMQAKTREQLQTAAENQAKNDIIDGMIEDMLASATLVYPPAAVDQEVDNRIESFKSQITRSGWEWDDYLKLQSMTEDHVRKDFREGAETAVRQQLALRQFVLSEKLTVGEEDVNAKITERVASFGDNETLINSMRDYYQQGAGFEMISGEILMDKVAERMEAILSGNAPDLAEETEEEAASDSESGEEADGEETAVTPETEDTEEPTEAEDEE